MVCKLSGLISHAKEKNPNIEEIHVNGRFVELLVTYDKEDTIKRFIVKQEKGEEKEIFSNKTLNKFIEDTKGE